MNIHSALAFKQEVNAFPCVRVATMPDLPQLLQMGRDLHRENGLLNLAEDKIEDIAYRGIKGDGGVIGVIGAVRLVQAIIHLVIGQYWYTNDVHIEELYSYVRPEFRKSDNAKSLIEFAKRCSDRMKIPLLIGVVSNHRTEEKVRLYRRRLGCPAGAYFLYNAKTGE